MVALEETAIARQWQSKHIPLATNTRAAIEELLDAVFSVRSVLYRILNMS
jgi:hypothetical protein